MTEFLLADIREATTHGSAKNPWRAQITGARRSARAQAFEARRAAFEARRAANEDTERG